MSEHREKAVEAATRAYWKGFDRAGPGPQRGMLADHDAALQGADSHLQRMYWERFREAVLSPETIEAAGTESMTQHHFRPYSYITKTLFEAALDKAQDLMEESK